MRNPSCSHTTDCVGCRAIRAVSSTMRASKYSKRRKVLSLCRMACVGRTSGNNRSVRVWLRDQSCRNIPSVAGPGEPQTIDSR